MRPRKQVAEQTLRVMRRVVPAAIPGIMFLSGGQVCLGWVGEGGRGVTSTWPEPTPTTLAPPHPAPPSSSTAPLFLVQTEEEATINLNRINQLAREQGRAPWSLSFSFGRSLQVKGA